MANKTSKYITIAHLNTRSLFTGFTELKSLIKKHDFDILAITETWLSDGIPSNAVNIPGYKLIRQDRDGRGGGVGFYVKSLFNCKIISLDNHHAEIEDLWVEIKIGRFALAIGVIYRPPNYNAVQCVEKIDNVLSHIIPNYKNIVVVGDVNVNLFQLNNCITNCFDTYGFIQLINDPTRVTLHSSTLIDPIFVNCSEFVIQSGVENADLISDHKLVFCKLKIPQYKYKQKFVTYRDFRQFENLAFLEDLHNTPWNNIIYVNNIDEKVHMLSENIIKLFDRHAPLKTVRVSKPSSPWLTDTIKIMMKERDKALEKYHLDPTEENWNSYKQIRNFTLSSIRREKAGYISHLYRERNKKPFWKKLKDMNVQSSKDTEIPENIKDVSKINDYFLTVYNKTPDCNNMINIYNNSKYNDSLNFHFSLVDNNEILDALSSIKSDAYGCDNISLMMIKLCTPVIIPYITHVINSCLEAGYFPLAWREAIICPVPKVVSPSSIKDLRPISLLPVLSKIFEKIIYKQIHLFFSENFLIPVHQSGFRSAHSTSTSLLNICDDVFRALDKKRATVLIALDFSKAFDTIDHDLMCAKLHFYGFDETSLSLFHCYLTQRSQRVKILNTLSEQGKVCSGVPQGSILGPLLFIIYTADISNTIQHSNIQAYADDTQILHHFELTNVAEASEKINKELESIFQFSKEHNLKLNPDKCSAMLFCSKQKRDIIKTQLNIKINDKDITFTDSLKNLGLTFDENLRFHHHVKKLIQKTYINLKLLYSHKHILNFSIKKTLCETLVLSVLGYCDMVYYPCLDKEMKNRVQKVQNACCRFIFGLRKFDSISDNIKDLCWLKLDKLVSLRYIVFVHRLLMTSTPAYLKAKLITRDNVHTCHIRHKLTLTMPQHSTAIFRRSFTYNAVTLYNSVNSDYKTLSSVRFKSAIKALLLNA